MDQPPRFYDCMDHATNYLCLCTCSLQANKPKLQRTLDTVGEVRALTVKNLPKNNNKRSVIWKQEKGEEEQGLELGRVNKERACRNNHTVRTGDWLGPANLLISAVIKQCAPIFDELRDTCGLMEFPIPKYHLKLAIRAKSCDIGIFVCIKPLLTVDVLILTNLFCFYELKIRINFNQYLWLLQSRCVCSRLCGQ